MNHIFISFPFHIKHLHKNSIIDAKTSVYVLKYPWNSFWRNANDKIDNYKIKEKKKFQEVNLLYWKFWLDSIGNIYKNPGAKFI